MLFRSTGLSGRTEQIRLGANCCTALPSAGTLCSNGTGSNAFYWAPGANAPTADTAAVSPTSSATQSGWTPWYGGQPSNAATEVYMSYFTFDANGYKWHDALENTAFTLREYGNNATYTAPATTAAVTFADTTPPTMTITRAASSVATGGTTTVTFTSNETTTNFTEIGRAHV